MVAVISQVCMANPLAGEWLFRVNKAAPVVKITIIFVAHHWKIIYILRNPLSFHL